jgi:hypothetical protein
MAQAADILTTSKSSCGPTAEKLHEKQWKYDIKILDAGGAGPGCGQQYRGPPLEWPGPDLALAALGNGDARE